MTVDSGYRPFVLKLTAFAMNGRVPWPLQLPVYALGLSLFLLPAWARERVLFRADARNEWTKNFSKKVHTYIG